MAVLGLDRLEHAREQRLLQDVADLAQRWDGMPPLRLLDAVLSSSPGARPGLPRQRGGRS